MRKKIILLFAVLVFVLAITEIGMRFAGFKPYRYSPHFEIKPKMMFVFDSLYGYRLEPGTYEMKDGNVNWTATNTAGGHRVTSWNDTIPHDDTLPAINIFGGAASYGYDLNDDATYPFILQQMLPRYKVRNFAVSGYGVMENYLQLIHLQNVRKGDVFIYTYKTDHDLRPSRTWQKLIYANFEELKMKDFYFTTLDTGLQPHLHKYDYHLWPLSHHSALMNFTENWYNNLRDEQDHPHDIARKAFLAMNEWCKTQGCTFILVGRLPDKQTTETLKYCADNGVQTVMLSKADIDIGKAAHAQAGRSGATGNDAVTSPNKIYAGSLFDYLVHQKLIDTMAGSK